MNKIIRQIVLKMAKQTLNEEGIENLCNDFNFDFYEFKETICFLFLEGFIRNNVNCPFGNNSRTTFRLTLKGRKLLNQYQQDQNFNFIDFQE